jgi:hypothetical protein
MSIATQVRDLEADLAICEAATPGPWIFNGNEIVASNDKRKGIAGALADEDCRFIAEAREGWSYAIRRALEAEAEADRLRNEIQILQEQLEQRCCRA